MYRSSFLLLALTLLWPQLAQATRIYSFVDYPDLQNGHSLQGTITTTDDAPDDGLLQTEEILDWEWEISGEYDLSVNGQTPIQIEGIAISPTSIEIPLFTNAILRLRRLGQGREPLPSLIWFHPFDDISGSRQPVFTGGIATDVFNEIWSSNLGNSINPNWVIATAVPEPNSLLLILVSLLTVIATSLRRSALSSITGNVI